jgi:hypothetical protein
MLDRPRGSALQRRRQGQQEDASRTTETINDRVPSCGSAGACMYDARLGSTSAAVASTMRIAVARALSESNRRTPWRSPPTTDASPSTSGMFDRIEPMMAARATAISPALRAKNPDEQLGQAAKRALRHAGHARPEPVAELLHATADD